MALTGESVFDLLRLPEQDPNRPVKCIDQPIGHVDDMEEESSTDYQAVTSLHHDLLENEFARELERLTANRALFPW